jgi:HTH-type transcriptional regulator/antitoxin HigA
MDIRPIKSGTDYSETLKEIESLMMAEANSPKA